MCARDRLFIAKMEMATRCRGVGGEAVGVKCGCMQGCCEGARQGVRSGRAMVQVAMNTKTNKVSAAARPGSGPQSDFKINEIQLN